MQAQTSETLVKPDQRQVLLTSTKRKPLRKLVNLCNITVFYVKDFTPKSFKAAFAKMYFSTGDPEEATG